MPTYQCCRDSKVNDHVVACDSPVGSGKTTAVMAYMLSQAKKHHLRRIFVVLPFTSIISQSVETYRRCLVLPGEEPNKIVAEVQTGHLPSGGCMNCREVLFLLMKHTLHCLRIFCRLHGNGSTASLTSGIAIGFLRRVLSTDSGRFSRLRQPEPGECQIWLTTRFVPRWRSMSRTASGISGIPHS